MTYNNPNITDLSDKNRPTKISERYSELYDNQWTDAFENLQTNHHLSDTEAIQFLLDVLYISFDVCEEARTQREGLLNALKTYIGVDGDDDVTIQEVMRTLKGTRRNINEMQKTFKKNAEKRLATATSNKEKLQDILLYMNECVDVCLLMNIQEPPVELYRRILLYDAPFDVSAFRPYTKTGNIIEYIVWPAMYLYQDGPLLCKGVAQGKRSSFNVNVLTSGKDDANGRNNTQELSGQLTDLMYVQVPNEIKANTENHTEIFKGSSYSTGLHTENELHQSRRETEKQNDKVYSSQYTDNSRQDEIAQLTMTTAEHLARTVQQENVDKLQIIPSDMETTIKEITHL